jgi:hypothetical protein
MSGAELDTGFGFRSAVCVSAPASSPTPGGASIPRCAPSMLASVSCWLTGFVRASVNLAPSPGGIGCSKVWEGDVLTNANCAANRSLQIPLLLVQVIAKSHHIFMPNVRIIQLNSGSIPSDCSVVGGSGEMRSIAYKGSSRITEGIC